MYLSNKYTTWYNQIILAAKSRTLSSDIYTENHHIIPKSLGGSNDSDNMALLTAREHFICHLLLTKMTSGAEKAKMVHASTMLARCVNDRQTRYIPPSKLYDLIKREISNVRKGSTQSAEARRKNSESQKIRNQLYGPTRGMLGKTHSTETKDKMMIAKLGQVITEESKQKISQSLKGRYTGELNPMARPEVKKKHLQGCLERSAVKVICPHCGGEFSRNTYALWHGDKCKLSKITPVS